VRIVENARVTGFDIRGDRVVAASTPQGEHRAAEFLVCAGAWTKSIAAKLGARLPIEAGKGYSFIVSPTVALRHGVLFPEAHAGATPLEDGLRIGGTMEFSGHDRSVNTARIETILAHVRKLVDLAAEGPREPWAGLRPTSADGLPIVDRLPALRNAYVASGYSMLGMTLSPPAGAAMAELIATGERPGVLDPFAVDRFRWRRSRRA
jgi:D-amino-acid dehydrogenase